MNKPIEIATRGFLVTQPSIEVAVEIKVFKILSIIIFMDREMFLSRIEVTCWLSSRYSPQ
jgi:hypothetical protein